MQRGTPTAQHVVQALRAVAREDKAQFYPGFFQAVPGGYGQGDQFLGCIVPDQRKIARQFRDLPLQELSRLFDSPWHEVRLTGMFILVNQFERAIANKEPSQASEAQALVDFYLANLKAVNNWDIVDATAHKILGRWLLGHPQQRKKLFELARSRRMWDRRVAVVATLPFIQNDEFDVILKLSSRLLGDDQDLMHKALGWMLREVGKRDVEVLRSFLEQHAAKMPRTMLRYSIEKLSPSERAQWRQR